MKLSVVIPAYDDAIGVMTCLNSLRAFQRTHVQYHVQDDASPQVLFPAIIPDGLATVDRNPQNLGFAGNCNAGAARTDGDVVMFVNQDVYAVMEWSDGWDSAILNAFSRPEVAVVGARLLFPDGSVQSAGGLFDAKRQPYHRCLGWRNPLYRDSNTPEAVPWVTGAAYAVRRSVWDALGGFDAVYGRGYFEDTDFCMKVRQAGGEVWYEPQATLIHRAGSTGGNPRFAENARIFKARWEAVIEPDVMAVKVGYW